MSATPQSKPYVHDDVAVYEAAAMRMRASWESPAAPAPDLPGPRPPPVARPRPPKPPATVITPRPSFAANEPSAPTRPVVPAPHGLPTRFMSEAHRHTYRYEAAKPAQRGPSRWKQLGVAAGITMALAAGVVTLLRPKAAPATEITQSAAPTGTAAALAPSTTPLTVATPSQPPSTTEPSPAVKSLAKHTLAARVAPSRAPEPARAMRPSAPAPRPARTRPPVARARPAGKRPAPPKAAPAPQMPAWTSLGSRAQGPR